ncbi:MAG TPA: DUF1289 domain-containing protein [Spongiibacteraceae bacterium]
MKSPCISVCQLNERDVCIGCWRTLAEIAAWSKFTDQQKRSVLQNCAKRQKTENRFG